jgi:hypothetical protein
VNLSDRFQRGGALGDKDAVPVQAPPVDDQPSVDCRFVDRIHGGIMVDFRASVNNSASAYV